MPVYHAGPFEGDEFAEACRRSGVSGAHQSISSGLGWCRLRAGWWRGLKVWFRIGMPATAKDAKARLSERVAAAARGC